MQPLLKWDRYAVNRGFLGPFPEVQGKTHPPNTVPYCEYHGGTQHGVAAGEWCVKCEVVRKWALNIIQSFSQCYLPEARGVGLKGTFKNEIINPDVMNWGVALGILGLFPDMHAQSVLRYELNATPEVGLEDIKNYVALGWETDADAKWKRLMSTH
jgi:hypothetical protein